MPEIFKIYFGGRPTNPTILVTGTFLDYEPNEPAPPHLPGYTPENHMGCPDTKGRPGYDYGKRLYFVDKSAKPVWAAGRYRPSLGELDCIGLVITAFGRERVEFHFGAFFRERHYRLNEGDFVGIFINGAATGVHVRYGPQGVEPGH